MHYEHKRLSGKYIEQEKSLAAYKEEKRLNEELGLFFKFIEEREIELKNLPDLKELDKGHLIEYFILLKNEREDNDQAIDRHIRTVQRFLHHLQDIGYIKNDPEYPDKVKEGPALYAY